MTITVEDLSALLGFPAVPADPRNLERALATSKAIVANHLSTEPEGGWSLTQLETIDHVTLDCAQELYRELTARGGEMTFADGATDYPVMLRDVMVKARPKLVQAGVMPAAVIA